MAQTPLADWCNPRAIAPSSWIPGFSDVSKEYLCAISGSGPDIATNMKDHCCKGPVQHSEDGCYQWCNPIAKTDVNWATCISDHVHTDDPIHFGYACNALGELEVKNAKNHYQKLRPHPDPNAGTALSASWKLGVLVGAVGLLQVLY